MGCASVISSLVHLSVTPNVPSARFQRRNHPTCENVHSLIMQCGEIHIAQAHHSWNIYMKAFKVSRWRFALPFDLKVQVHLVYLFFLSIGPTTGAAGKRRLLIWYSFLHAIRLHVNERSIDFSKHRGKLKHFRSSKRLIFARILMKLFSRHEKKRINSYYCRNIDGNASTSLCFRGNTMCSVASYRV